MDSTKLLSVLIFTDGASSGNPGPGGWGAIIVTPEGRITELGGREARTTNNRMELMAVLRALGHRETQGGPVEIFTDSTYVIRGMTQWIWAWQKKGWLTSTGSEVANTEVWKAIAQVSQKRKIGWNYVPGHSGIPGNERADEIAVAYSQDRSPHLYSGTLSNYGIDIQSIPENTDLPEQHSKKQAPSKPYSYLSLVGGVPLRHSTWPECEQRVKGQSGAKFKKAMTAHEEKEVLRSWGFSPEDLAN